MTARLRLVARAAIAIGLLIDAYVGILAIFFQPLLGPLLDIPVRDPALATIAGGETLIAACVYAFVLRDFDRFRPLLYLLALDQVFAIALPSLEIARGHVAATMKTLGPMPFNALLAAFYVFAARSSLFAAPGSGR